MGLKDTKLTRAVLPPFFKKKNQTQIKSNCFVTGGVAYKVLKSYWCKTIICSSKENIPYYIPFFIYNHVICKYIDCIITTIGHSSHGLYWCLYSDILCLYSDILPMNDIETFLSLPLSFFFWIPVISPCICCNDNASICILS